MQSVLFICGELCAGKTTYCVNQGFSFVEVSFLVKQIIHTNDRNKLQETAYLENTLVEKLHNEVNKNNQIVICGVRQPALIFSFENPYVIWIDVPYEIRLRRYLNRADVNKDTLTIEAFNTACEKDNKLGLQSIKQYINNNSIKGEILHI